MKKKKACIVKPNCICYLQTSKAACHYISKNAKVGYLYKETKENQSFKTTGLFHLKRERLKYEL